MGEKHNKGMPRNHKCKYCAKTYAMEWARNNHEVHCKKNPNRGKKWD